MTCTSTASTTTTRSPTTPNTCSASSTISPRSTWSMRFGCSLYWAALMADGALHLLFLSEGVTFSAVEISRELLEVRVWPLFSYQGPLLWQTQRLPSQAWFLWFYWTRRLLLWAEEGKTLAACSFSFFPSMVHSWAAFHTIFRSLLILDVICFLRYLSLGYPYVNM